MVDALLNIFARIVVPLFFVGMAGSALVVVLTVVRDLRQMRNTPDTDVTDL